MTELNSTQLKDAGALVSNANGENSLFSINRDVFQDTDADTVFRSYFGDSLFEKNTFYVIAGTDSGLLYQYIKNHNIPKGSRYLFVELPQVLTLLGTIEPQTADDASQRELAVASGENWQELAQAMGAENYAPLDKMLLIRSLGIVHGHFSDYASFWRKLKKECDALIWNYKVAIGNSLFFIRQIENLTENQVPAIHLKGTFNGKTAVVLAGGPSLDDLLPWVRQHRKNLLVIAVSRISTALTKSDIQPDIIVSIDPLPVNLMVSRDMFKFQNDTLLVNDFHINSDLLSSWGGQKMFIGPRYPWTTPLQPENLSPTIGTTVTNTAFELAVTTGVTQIILGGVDFCFSQKGYSHASESMEHTTGPRLQSCEQQIETNNGQMADTLNAYVRSADPVDKVAQNAMIHGCRTINPAPGAMRLPNIEHISVDEIQIEPMEQSAKDVLAACIPQTDSKTRITLYKEILGETDHLLRELTNIKKQSSKALVYNHKLFAMGEPGSGLHNKNKIEHIEKQLNEKYSLTSKFIRTFGVIRFLPIQLLDDDRYVEDLEECCRIYHQAFVDTSDELIEILRQARSRTMSRLEEEKSQPNVTRLIEQWRNDHQPGRAIFWARHHVNVTSRLPSAQQNELTALQSRFDSVIDKIGEQYYPRSGPGVALNCVATWAQEYFLAQDKDNLLRLSTALQGQHDKQQATPLTALVQGYLSELDDKQEDAAVAYESITEGEAQEKALMRMFDLYCKKQDYDSSLKPLKKLSSINSTYTPMYADMLQSRGDTDKAAEIYTDYLLDNPDDLNTMMKLGKLFQQCGSAEGVIWTMGYILDKDPKNQTAQKILHETGLSEEVQPPP